MWKKRPDITITRLRIIAVFFLAVALWIVAHLFSLQVLEHEYYSLFAFNTHEIYKKIHPERGMVYFQDSRNHSLYPVAMNRPYYLVYASPKDIEQQDVKKISEMLIKFLNITDNDKKEQLYKRLKKHDSWYQVVEKKVDKEIADKITQANLPGIHISAQEYRYYPEERLGSTILGFCSRDEEGNSVGKYGVEGFLNKELTGKIGYIAGEKGGSGSWITFSGRKIVPAENGADIVLTIDRTLQYQACERLARAMKEYSAKSASLVLMNPQTGAILAMCSLPDFDSNKYNEVKSLEYFNNTTIFNAYEPGSVFKPITMAIGLDLKLVNPQTTFTDPCKREYKNVPRPIYNALNKCYGVQTMTQVLEKSINTGIIWVVEKIGLDRFTSYVEKFGFGKKTGVDLSPEVSGTISSLYKKLPVNSAYASFGQGISVTPLQLAVSYSALAHEGKLPRPYIVDEVRYENGATKKTDPYIVGQVISPQAAELVTGMLVSTVKNTYSKTVALPNQYVAAKTGTAQISVGGRYDATKTNHTLVGFAPADNAQFVLVVKFEEPNEEWAESTAGPVFRDVMKYALDYYAVSSEK